MKFWKKDRGVESIKKILRTPTALVVLLAAILALIGVIYKSTMDIAIARLPIDATQTAEAKSISIASLLTPTVFACDSGAIPTISTPQPMIPEPTLVIVMVDENTTQESLEIVLSSLNESLQAGDRVIVIVSGEQTYDKAIVADDKIPSIAPVIITPLPSPLPTPTPTPVETFVRSFQFMMATRTAQAVISQATQTSIQYSYYCSIYQWNSSYQTTYLQWKAESKKLVSETITTLAQQIQHYGILKPTNNGVFESINLISNIFRTECTDDKFKKCVFVPITNMFDFRMAQPPSDIQVNLNTVEVVGTIANCSLYNQECQNRANYWINYLIENNVRFAQFVNLNEFGSLLSKTLSR